jgi:ABC-type uncharacterized transport system ATPase subunit
LVYHLRGLRGEQINMGAVSSVQQFELAENLHLTSEQKKRLQSLYERHKEEDHLSISEILQSTLQSAEELDVTEKQYIRFVAKQVALELSERALRDAILSLSMPEGEKITPSETVSEEGSKNKK